MTVTLEANGNIYTDDSDPLTGMGNGGWRKRLLRMLSDVMVDVGNKLAVMVGIRTSVVALTGTIAAAQSTLTMSWDVSTTDANPGSGKVRGNAGSQIAITQLFISTADALGGDVTAVLADYGASTSEIKGRLRLVKISNGAVFFDAAVTGVTAASGYRKIAVTYLAGPGGFAAGDAVAVGFAQTGWKGSTGATGTAATVAVGAVTTGAAGSSAIVTNSGTSGAATFNFTIPRGDTGATGPTGATGATGPAGGITGGNATGAINETAATLASASTVAIGSAAGNYLTITGATTITAFDTVQAGTERVLRFAAALTLTHNATSLILPGGASITTAAGDIAAMRSEGSGNWRCVSYTRATGVPLTGSGIAVQDEGSAVATASTINFVGPSVTVSNVSGVATVTIANTVLADGAEDGSTIGWAAEANASLVNSTTQANSGTCSWLYSCSAASNYFVSKQIPNLVSGTTYTVTFWAKMTSGSGARTVMIRPNSFGGVAAYNSAYTFTSSWTQYTFTFVAAATTMYLHLGNDPGTACAVYLDDIVVRS